MLECTHTAHEHSAPLADYRVSSRSVSTVKLQSDAMKSFAQNQLKDIHSDLRCPCQLWAGDKTPKNVMHLISQIGQFTFAPNGATLFQLALSRTPSSCIADMQVCGHCVAKGIADLQLQSTGHKACRELLPFCLPVACSSLPVVCVHWETCLQTPHTGSQRMQMLSCHFHAFPLQL